MAIVLPGGNSKYLRNQKLAKALTNESILLQISGLQKQAEDIVSVAKKNALKDEKELNYTLDQMAQDFRRLSATQRAAAGASGFLVNSGSFLQVYAEAANQFDLDVSRRKEITTLNQRTMIEDALRQAEALQIQAQQVEKARQIEKLGDF